MTNSREENQGSSFVYLGLLCETKAELYYAIFERDSRSISVRIRSPAIKRSISSHM